MSGPEITPSGPQGAPSQPHDLASTPPAWTPPPPQGTFGFTGTYPIGVSFDRDQMLSRAWGIPFLGILVRSLLAIPHWIVLAFFGMLVGLLQFVTWIPVLFGGRYPRWGYDLVGGYARWMVRVVAYVLLLAAPYPPFSTTAPYPVDVTFDRDQVLSRAWGIPFFGILGRSILAIPHWIILYVLGIVVGLLNFITWVPVLMGGRYPQWGYDLVGGYYRYSVRVTCWVVLMAGPYPPFRLQS